MDPLGQRIPHPALHRSDTNVGDLDWSDTNDVLNLGMRRENFKHFLACLSQIIEFQWSVERVNHDDRMEPSTKTLK